MLLEMRGVQFQVVPSVSSLFLPLNLQRIFVSNIIPGPQSIIYVLLPIVLNPHILSYYYSFAPGFRPLSFPGNGGVINYVGECNPLTYLCNRCEAGCTSDEDCVGDLVCQKRTGFEPVPGCFHEGGPYDMKSKGVCYDGSLKPELLYYGHHCKDYHPHPYKCPLCGGGCENDHDCKGDLRCAKRDGLENVPGCAWGLNSTLHQYLGDTSYCFDPFVGNPVANNVVRYIGECSPYIPGYLCGECQGGCKTDSDCQFGLKCLHRSGAVGDGFHDVPGCKDEGGERDVWGKGICYDPAKVPIV